MATKQMRREKRQGYYHPFSGHIHCDLNPPRRVHPLKVPPIPNSAKLGTQLSMYMSLGWYLNQTIAPPSGRNSLFPDWDRAHELIGEMGMPFCLLKRVSDNHKGLGDPTKNVLSEGVSFPCWRPAPAGMPFQMFVILSWKPRAKPDFL